MLLTTVHPRFAGEAPDAANRDVDEISVRFTGRTSAPERGADGSWGFQSCYLKFRQGVCTHVRRRGHEMEMNNYSRFEAFLSFKDETFVYNC